MAGAEGLTGVELQAYRLGQELMKNPEVHKNALRLAKQANPALRIPEIEAEQAVEAERTRATKREDELHQELIAERVARRDRELTDRCAEAGVERKRVDAIVTSEKCSIETALKMAVLERDRADASAPEVRHGGNPPATPLDMRPAGDWKKLTPEAAARKAADLAHGMVDELAAQRRKRA
jgi:hypothetical protein